MGTAAIYFLLLLELNIQIKKNKWISMSALHLIMTAEKLREDTSIVTKNRMHKVMPQPYAYYGSNNYH